jgi:hypothetical protein
MLYKCVCVACSGKSLIFKTYKLQFNLFSIVSISLKLTSSLKGMSQVVAKSLASLFHAIFAVPPTSL